MSETQTPFRSLKLVETMEIGLSGIAALGLSSSDEEDQDGQA